MRRLKFGLAAALIVLALLVVQAPARLLTTLLPADSVLLQGVRGTLWRGTAARGSLRVADGRLYLGAVQWRLSPWSLLLLSPRVTVSSRWGNQHIDATVVYGGDRDLALSNLDAALPASLVREFLPVELTGSLSLLAKRVVVQDGMPVAADGRVVWQYAGWVSPQGPRSLGQYVLDIRQEDGGDIVGDVSTLDGGVQAQGRVALSQRNYDVDVRLSGPGLQDPSLEQALQLVAAPEGDGFRVQLQGAF